MNDFMLGDMLVTHRPDDMKLLKAAAVISAHLHDTLSTWPLIASTDKSKRSCVWASLTVRDFLRRVGFVQARCLCATVLIHATRGSETLHSAAIGHPIDRHNPLEGHWPGHLVVLVDGFLIDTTLYQINRLAWPQLPGMVMIKADALPGQQWEGLDALCGMDMIEHASADKQEYRCGVLWLDNDTNRSWKAVPDARKHRREFAVKALVEKFTWRSKHDTTPSIAQAS